MEKSKECLAKIKGMYFSLPWYGKILGLAFFLYVILKVIPILATLLQGIAFIAVMAMIFLSQFSNEEMEKKINEFSESARAYLKGEHIDEPT